MPVLTRTEPSKEVQRRGWDAVRLRGAAMVVRADRMSEGTEPSGCEPT